MNSSIIKSVEQSIIQSITGEVPEECEGGQPNEVGVVVDVADGVDHVDHDGRWFHALVL